MLNNLFMCHVAPMLSSMCNILSHVPLGILVFIVVARSINAFRFDYGSSAKGCTFIENMCAFVVTFRLIAPNMKFSEDKKKDYPYEVLAKK